MTAVFDVQLKVILKTTKNTDMLQAPFWVYIILPKHQIFEESSLFGLKSLHVGVVYRGPYYYTQIGVIFY